MRNLKLLLAYDGTNYSGWQYQHGKVSLQATLEAAIERITGEKLRVIASGRTDAGVHAQGQVVCFYTHSTLSTAVLFRALNCELPNDMAVLQVEEVPLEFHAIRAAQRKRYRYVIHHGRKRDVLLLRHCWHVYQELSLEAMREAAQVFVGTHDFKAYESNGSTRSTSIRTIYELSLIEPEKDLLWIEVEADGFLYNMVRNIVGTLVEVGRNKKPPQWPGEVLASLDRRQAGMKAPAQGLILLSVTY